LAHILLFQPCVVQLFQKNPIHTYYAQAHHSHQQSKYDNPLLQSCIQLLALQDAPYTSYQDEASYRYYLLKYLNNVTLQP